MDRQTLLDALTGTTPAALPFSFRYEGSAAHDLLPHWGRSTASRAIDTARTEHMLTLTDPETGLVVRCITVEYAGFPHIEWTVHLENRGHANTPILSDILPLDLRLERGQGEEFVLHHHVGSPCQPNDYQPLATRLVAGKEIRVSAAGGRPTNSDLPYFNLVWGGRGAIIVVGWPGQWSALFRRDGEAGLSVQAGQERTHFTLHPGESVRTPLIVIQVWEGDRIASQNVWRRWMLAHNLPRPGGRLPDPQTAGVSGSHFHLLMCNEVDEILFIDRYLEERIPLTYWWMDAGWYPCDRHGWPETGTWEPDPVRFPHGIRRVCDHAHAHGIKALLWFEPERVVPGTWLYEHHPEWLLGEDGKQKLLNLGNPEARTWLTDHFDRILTEQGIDLYRQDHNVDPLEYWRRNDAPDRQGMTEIGHVTGYLAFWDELRRRHPAMLIDSCASGGRRNDLETLRRAVPLLRSDYWWDPLGQQCHTYGIASWFPFYGSGFEQIDLYTARSVFCPHLSTGQDVRRRDLDYDLLRRIFAEWQRVAQYLLGDYYPLTSYSMEDDVWMAWQFDRPDLGGGMVQMFRRARSPFETARFCLQGLDPDTIYCLTDFDRPGDRPCLSGRELMEQGLAVSMLEKPQSKIVMYQRQ